MTYDEYQYNLEANFQQAEAVKEHLRRAFSYAQKAVDTGDQENEKRSFLALCSAYSTSYTVTEDIHNLLVTISENLKKKNIEHHERKQ